MTMKIKEKMKRITKKHVAAVFFSLMLAVSITGISAWLVDASGTLSNQFDGKELEIDISETDMQWDEEEDKYTNTYEITFGKEDWDDINKDPSVNVSEDQVECWVFVTLEKSDNFDDFLVYEIADGWTPLGEDYPGIYYRSCASSPESQSFNVLKENTVSVKEGVTKDQVNALTKDTYPKLDITGFAIQLSGFDTATAAWEAINAD